MFKIFNMIHIISFKIIKYESSLLTRYIYKFYEIGSNMLIVVYAIIPQPQPSIFPCLMNCILWITGSMNQILQGTQ